ncbi:MAG TPA: GH3 auxin-responsive promoter family protein, partial [Anaerolineales bacterium]|nr:GH3 auxin-responsive promoter family protein [Anaerolineales bacterium]
MQAPPTPPNPQEMQAQLKQMLRPWEAALENPTSAQEGVLHQLLLQYAQTGYGQTHGAGVIESLADYRRAFPVANYADFRPLIQAVMSGDIGKLLWEEPLGWAITRGTTQGESKFIPMTPTDMR